MGNVYSFINVTASLTGPTGFVNLGSGAATSEEGITIEPTTDKNMMAIGADGLGQHSLIADDSATVTIRLLKTAPANAILMAMYDAQSISSSLWGQNSITIIDKVRLDTTVCQSGSFKKKPTLTYAKEGGMMEWTFDFIKVTSILGV